MKLHLSSLFLLLIGTFSVEAQEGWLASKWSVEAVFAPNISNRILTNPKGNEAWHIMDRERSDIARIGYSSRFAVNYHFHDRWHIGLGLGYASIGFDTKSKELTWASVVQQPTEVRSSHRYSYVGIYLLTNYQLAQYKRWRTYLTFGLVMHTYLDKNIFTETKVSGNWGGQSNWGFEYDRHNLFAVLGISNTFRIHQGLVALVNLHFSQAVTPSNNSANTKELLNYLSLEIGLQYRFKRKR